tara:strand:+ start:153 stop:371 length:219 start_codon:yes stop_codon:yes gene_type:complete
VKVIIKIKGVLFHWRTQGCIIHNVPMRKLGVFVLTLFLIGCGKSWKEVEDYDSYYRVDIDKSVECSIIMKML